MGGLEHRWENAGAGFVQAGSGDIPDFGVKLS